ncbi:MAG TPA: hypothetical protein DHW82_10435 [Spirochaetia bacterium]|nr:hypothetical protein [Spirochaetia bacterium]
MYSSFFLKFKTKDSFLSLKEDKEIIFALLNGGSPDDFGILVKKYEKLVFRILHKFFYFKDRSMIEDAAQEVFMTIYEKLDRYNPDYSFLNWLYTLTVNKAKKLLRKEKIKNFFPLFEEIVETEEKKGNLEEEEIKLWLWKEIKTLPVKYQIILVLYYTENLSTTEIAEIMEESENTVKSKLKRAREKLKISLSENERWKLFFE